MVDTVTLALGIALVGVGVYAIGIERTTSATKTGASTAKRAAESTYTQIAAGAATGLVAGDALVQFVASDPATLVAALTGVLGTLGLGGVVDLSATQFALIAVGLLVGYYAIFAEATEEDD